MVVACKAGDDQLAILPAQGWNGVETDGNGNFQPGRDQ